jgi:predicted nucleotide-binding protein (sugar kinase/HSP70/actin superfamily)
MGSYEIAFRALIEGMGGVALSPPKMTRRTLELGARHSPEFVCVPFKYNLGNFIEALDEGANVVVQAGGGCRFGYYAEVQEQILHDLGHDLEFIMLTGNWSTRELIAGFRRVAPGASYPRIARAFVRAWAKGKAIEAIEDFVRKNVGFECEPGTIDRIVARALRDLERATSRREIAEVRSRASAELETVALDKPADCLRVGVVGELYILMEPFSNHNVERRLADHGVEVHRFVTLSSLITHGIRGRPHVDHMIELAGPWSTHHLGADGTESVARTWQLMREGFDGMVHVKPFGCMPEVSATSALQRIGREHTFPTLSISYDAQTAETGIVTRIEAFCDMLQMRKRKAASGA